ncbi:ABC transporter permease [Actinospica robiniae]|uniref:ABC transporter permease n=1 Tax=Actinospica robiniae TaxID=304901 RepID=UPI000411D450|nr:ABC transporter permease subunit [Actinospica robiniae]
MTAISAASAASPHPARPKLRGLAWVTLRQQRTALLALTAVLACCAFALVFYGLRMHADYRTLGLSDCVPQAPHRARDCAIRIQEFGSDQNRVNQLMAFFLPLPVLFGLFLGAPLLAREYESGTYRFAFTQAAGATRWLVSKIALLTVFTIAVTAAFTCVVIWWYAPLVPLNGRLGNTSIQEIYGAVFVARAVFALAVGLIAGALLRRVVPAIGVTLVVWIAVVVPSITELRPHLLSPLTLVNGGTPSGWIISDTWTNPSGHTLTLEQIGNLTYNAALAGHKLDMASYLAGQGYRHTVIYQPASRFWALQSIEAGGLAVVSVILLAATVWVVRRRSV